MQIEHIFMTYDGGAYNPSKLSYDPIAQKILDDPRVSNSLIFDKNRRTIYAQGLEYGKHHHTTSNNWHIATVFDIEALGKGAKRGRSLEYNITESKLYAKTPKIIKWNPTFNRCFIIDENNTLYVAIVDKNNNLELDEENKVENVIDAVWSSDGSTIFIKYVNGKLSDYYGTDNYIIYKVGDDKYTLNNEFYEVWDVSYEDNFDFITIIGKNRGTPVFIVIDKTGEIIAHVYGEYHYGDDEHGFYKVWINSTGTKAVIKVYDRSGGRYYASINLPLNDSYTSSYQNDALSDQYNEYANAIISPDGKNIYMFGNDYIYDIINDESIYESNNGNILNAKFIDDDTIFVHTYSVSNIPDIPDRGNTKSSNDSLYFINTKGDVLLSNFTGNVFCKFNNDNTKAIVISLSEPEPLIELDKGVNNPQPGDVYIWEIEDNNVIGPIYNINLSTSYDYNDDIEFKGPSRSINYDQPNIKVIWNDDSSMVVVIDEYGNATVFDDEGNVISENIATNVSGGHWSNGNLYLDNAIETLSKPVIVDINLDIEGNLTYQTRNLQMGTGTCNDESEYKIVAGHSGYFFITGIQQSPSGQISYSYDYLTVAPFKNTGSYTNKHDSYNIVNVNMYYDGNFTYAYSDLKSTPDDGSYLGAYLIDSPTSYLRVITGINQERDGKISYAYQSVYTYHYGWIGPNYFGDTKDFVTSVTLHDDGHITGSTGTFTNQRTGSTTSGVINNVNLDHTGKLSYSYVSLENLLNVTPESIDEGAYTMQNNTSYQVITNISQNANGSISYTYGTFNTIHTSSGQNDGDLDDYVITYVWLDADGNFSYKYRNQETAVGDGLAGFRQDVSTPTITLQNAHSYRFITNINQAKDGKIVYTYADVNTTHTSTGIVDRDIDDRVITNVHLDADGNFSYSYANHETTTSDRLKAVKVGGDATITLTGPSTSYTFVTQIDQTSDGKIIYTYAYVNTTHTTATSNSNTNKVVTYVNLDSDGNLTYYLTDLSVTAGTAGSNMILTNDDTYKFITGITQASDGKISYTYSQLNTNFTYQGDNIDGPVYELNIDKTGKVSYVHKNLTVSSGALSNDGDIITNDSTYRFITGISQASDGKISYTYGVFNTDFSNNGTTNGVLTNVNIDNAGHLSYDSVDLSTNKGKYDDERSYTKGVKIEMIPSQTSTYTLVLNNISQSSNGKISYSYVGIYTDPRDYTYHDLTLTGSDITLDDENNVKVISKITIDKQGNQKDHTLTYSYVQVPTREYVDSLITANDAMRYCGTFNIVLDENDNPCIRIVCLHDPDLSKGAVYKYDSIEQATIDNHTFSLGDWIMSNNDENTYTGFASGHRNIYTINSLDGWDTFNVNIFINSVGDNGTNQNRSDTVITNIYANDSGTISYTFTNLAATIAGLDDNNTNELLGSTYDVITGINVVQYGLETQLSYTYTTIKVNQAHHSTNTANTGSQLTIKNANNENKVVTGVSLSADGTLSYTVQPLKTKSASTHLNATNHEEYVITYAYLDSDGVLSYHTRDLSVSTGTQGTAVDLRSSSINVIDGITQDKAGKIAYHYASISATQNHHGGSASGDFLTGVELSQSGTLSGSNGTFSTHNYGDASGVITYVDLTHTGQLSFSYVDLSGNTGTTATSNNKFVNGISQAANGKITYTYAEITNETFANHHSTNNTQTGGASYVIGAVHLSESGELSYSYTDIAKVAYHYTPAWPMIPGPMHNATITIPYNSTGSSESITAYINLTYDSKGHLIDSAKGNYSFAHGAVTTSGSNLGQKVITIAAAGTNSDDLKSYTSLTASNGHLTNATYGSYVFKHGAPSGGTTYSLSVPVGSYINALTLTYDTNGHMTGYGFSTAPFVGKFTDENVNFETTNKLIYLSGKKDEETTPSHAYIDGITYIENGSLYTQNIEASINVVGLMVSSNRDINAARDITAGGAIYTPNIHIGEQSNDSINIRAKRVSFNEPSEALDFTGLKALWGVVVMDSK